MSLEMIEPPSKEVLEKVRSEFGLNDQRVRDAVEQLKQWIYLQPHLPKEIGTLAKNTANSDTPFKRVDMQNVEVFAVLRRHEAYAVVVYRRFGTAYRSYQYKRHKALYRKQNYGYTIT
jgi:uncharacterized protein (DUF2126 family)